MAKISILVIDDHPLMRQGVKEVITRGIPGALIGEASDAAGALSEVEAHAWDLILLDISLPGRSGIDLLKELHGRWPRLPVLVFSSHPEEEFAMRVLRAGAAGYLHKTTSPNTVLTAVRTVLEGTRYISPTLAEQLAANLSRDPTRAPHELLSDRELDVMLRIAAGRSVGEIAEDLKLSVKTVSTYRARILQKTGMKNNAELVQYAVRNKLVN